MDVGSEWSSILERSSLRFAFDDGEVKAVCPHDTDPAWAVNIKRGILSAFQAKHGVTSFFFNLIFPFNFISKSLLPFFNGFFKSQKNIRSEFFN